MGATSSRVSNPFLYYNHLKEDATPQKKKICLLLIDPQNDFVLPTGSLSVPGAVEDCERIRSAFAANLKEVDDVFVTMDTHQKYHIAHSIFWKNNKGEHPKPFSAIAVKDVEAKVWFTANPAHQKWALHYVKALEKGGRFQLTIWPEHCLIGTTGQAVYEPLMAALHEWEATNLKTTNFILKGNNAFTEHYSALKAEVPMKEDPRTFLNTQLVSKVEQYERILVAGQALSHCVNFTVRDLIDVLPAHVVKRIAIISDGSSSVAGFEQAGKTFMDDMKRKGVRLIPASEAFSSM